MGLIGKIFGKGINALVAEAREDPDAVILDVRTPEEYASGHIEGAYNVPLDRIGEAIGPYGDRHLYVYCASGARSRQAVAQLKAAGVAEVQNIGGIMSWVGPVVAK